MATISCSAPEPALIDDSGVSDSSTLKPDMCGWGDDEKIPRHQSAIVNGTAQPTLYQFSAGQINAMGAMLRRTSQGSFLPWCNATLITQKAAITAAHCLFASNGQEIEIRDIRFGTGEDMASPSADINVVETLMHPDYEGTGDSRQAVHDVALLILENMAGDIVTPFTPMPVNRQPLDDSITGMFVQNQGFGDTKINPDFINTRRFWTVEPVVELREYEFVVDGQGISSVCTGDSGGPSFFLFNDGVIRIMGTVSWGDYSCVGYDHFARTDFNLEWMDSVIDTGKTDYCSDVDTAGICLNGAVLSCTDAGIEFEDCIPEGGRCVEDSKGARCIITDGGIVDPCERLGFTGACFPGEVARWCENGSLKKRKCASCDQICAWAGPDLGYYCVSP